MPAEAVERKLVAILAADIADYFAPASCRMMS
jgi:hypothetical protein